MIFLNRITISRPNWITICWIPMWSTTADRILIAVNSRIPIASTYGIPIDRISIGSNRVTIIANRVTISYDRISISSYGIPIRTIRITIGPIWITFWITIGPFWITIRPYRSYRISVWSFWIPIITCYRVMYPRIFAVRISLVRVWIIVEIGVTIPGSRTVPFVVIVRITWLDIKKSAMKMCRKVWAIYQTNVRYYRIPWKLIFKIKVYFCSL